MEIVAANPSNGNVPPFHNHDVREWSRIDSLTGCLERARLETDHWTANTANSSHKYGKVVDSRARSGADGSLQQEAKRQLEVFQSQIPGGKLQVIKTHTVSSSRWTSNSKSASPVDADRLGFENLQLTLNPLDLTSQKSKASVGRAGSRRPPSRQQRFSSGVQSTAATNLYRVSRICHQFHDDAVWHAFAKIPVGERENGDGVEIVEIESDTDKKSSLKRTKSTSSEDLIISDSKSTRSSEDLEDLEQLQNWRRTSKIRRSLQFPKQNKTYSKPDDLPQNIGSVRRIREDLEKGRRLNTALRGNNVDLEALDQILQTISDKEEKLPKRNSFVTVESIQAVKDKLRRTSSPSLDFSKSKEDIDDGIVDSSSSLKIDMPSSNHNYKSSKVRSYVYGMENPFPRKEISGTGSLESRSKHLNGSSSQKEDWYNRRKSYGFEKVAQQDETISKSKVESSTDSGICRSSEIIVVPQTKSNENLEHKWKHDTNNNSNNEDDWKKNNKDWKHHKESSKVNISDDWKKYKNGEIEGTMITIPIISKNSPVNVRRKLFERELGDGTSYSIESWRNEDPEVKRHSIAVDESKYVTKADQTKFRRTSLAINSNDVFDDDDLNLGKKKRVEFCKTEVHFAADSGKVNIVETDEKPPPTNNFRRRRKYSGLIPTEEFNTNGLPVFQFGDQIHNGDSDIDNDENDDQNGSMGVVTVNTNITNEYFKEMGEDNREESWEVPKGILKNKPMKPKPYILGEIPQYEDNFDVNYIDGSNSNYKYRDDRSLYYEDEARNHQSEEDHLITPWGVKLKSVKDDSAPIWRSTVTVKNTLYNQPNDDLESQNHKGPCKRDYGIRIVSPTIDTRRSSWSVADRIKQVEDLQYVENKGYSTKINFGDGQATIVENEKFNEVRHPTWSRKEESSLDPATKNLLNKSLVVRIGRDDSLSKHTVRSKMTTDQDARTTTTTTKITIDLTPKVTNPKKAFAPLKTVPKEMHGFKSTSLILNTLKTDVSNISNREHSQIGKTFDSEPRIRIPQQLEELRRLYEDVQSDSETDKEVQSLMSRESDLQVNKMDNECSSIVSGSWRRVRAFKNVSQYAKVHNCIEENQKDLNALLEKDMEGVHNIIKVKPSITSNIKPQNNQKSKQSPLITRKNVPVKAVKENNDKLSSPALVVQKNLKSEITNTRFDVKQSKTNAKTDSLDRSQKKNLSPSRIRNKSPPKEVLRQPKKSEMAYFGVPVSPQVTRKAEKKEIRLSEKPDLLQFNTGKDKEPTYENFEEAKKKYKSKEFDASILDELTKAADQILQAVNGYDDYKSTDDEKLKHYKPLDTISETRSWRKEKATQARQQEVSKPKLKQTSSNSSLESVKDRRSTTKSTSSLEQKSRRKIGSDSSSVKATKARRLQRASSREALLQSHGSSSEDLAIEIPLRKPRLVRKTKTTTTQLSLGNGLEIKKTSTTSTSGRRKPEDIKDTRRRTEDTKQNKNKTEERVPQVALPEIRHRTAVSTIRSTAEKAASRAEKVKSSDLRKKTDQKVKESKSQSVTKPERSRTVPSRENSQQQSQHQKISTANIKKCSRYDGTPK